MKLEELLMDDATERHPAKPDGVRKRSEGLLLATSIYGLLYLWFIIVSLFPAPEGSWVSPAVPFEPFSLDQIFVKLLFLLFLIGYLAVWKNELIGGAIFLLYWVGWWCVEMSIELPDGGVGIVLGFPVFVLGILYVRHWYKRRSVETVQSRK
jgi:hypothetical protein